MSTFIELDSKFRNRECFSNPAEYRVDACQTAGWSNLIRDVQCVRPCSKKEACNLLFCVKLLKLAIPTRIVDTAGDTVSIIAEDPFNNAVTRDVNCLYVHFSTSRYTDSNLIRTINNEHRDATFVAVPMRTFVGAPDGGGNSVEWTFYESHMLQCIRLEDKKPVITFRVFTNQLQAFDGPFAAITGGVPIPGFTQSSNSVRIYDDNLATTVLPNPRLQIRALFELTPYVRDGSYENHLVSLWADN